jgi:hypothetical protein
MMKNLTSGSAATGMETGTNPFRELSDPVVDVEPTVDSDQSGSGWEVVVATPWPLRPKVYGRRRVHSNLQVCSGLPYCLFTLIPR